MNSHDLVEVLKNKPELLREILIELGIAQIETFAADASGQMLGINDVLTNLGFQACEIHNCPRIDVSFVAGLTSYEWNGEGENPNRGHWYCPEHAEEYIEYWNNMWAEYHANLL